MKKMQLIETILCMVAIVGSVIIGLGLSNQLTMAVLNCLMAVLIVIGLVMPFVVILYARRYSKVAFYNSLNQVVEIHIGRHGSSMKLARIVGESKRLAKRLNKGLLFYTNHFSEERLREKFGNDMAIKKANVFQRVSFYIPYYIVTFGIKKGNRYPLLRCEMFPE